MDEGNANHSHHPDSLIDSEHQSKLKGTKSLRMDTSCVLHHVFCASVCRLLCHIAHFSNRLAPINIKPYNAEILLYKPWRPKGLLQFEIIIDVSVSSFRFI